ncbi:hypothetical protein MHYP_G00203060 [Metynnis hypsauchen]
MTNTNCAAADELSSLTLHLQSGPTRVSCWMLDSVTRVLPADVRQRDRCWRNHLHLRLIRKHVSLYGPLGFALLAVK